MLDISVIILTYNEKIHIERCINNAKKFAKEIYLVDCYSEDGTVEMAQSMGAKVFQHPWENYSKQFNWALQNLPITTEWIWRMDADEYLSDDLISELHQKLPSLPNNINGFTAPCLRIFMGKYIKHGIIPLILLRLFKIKYAICENRYMDEHIQLSEGKIGSLKNPFYDDNLNGLTWWTNKHNGYATREAIDLLLTEYDLLPQESVVNSGAHSAAIRKKKLKYIKLPLFWRAFAFFILRYIFRLGFLDGKEGFLWHFLQGFWYRTLADAKVYEIKKNHGFDSERIKTFLKENYLK
ncbi:glycosyltransferase family 2 protein [Phocaeicola plebeius]|jgi:glycosyltransferase involved in cell wall biosynthesis|uniref:Glycosyltransferase family 2 protein n=1 Tax=Phocaeicola plebeius TaxID=310297 RepID=A0A414RF89_9BACT|nr:glycosyltransferase family 2 protein [Phocaeicola plebeius]RHF91683.1 glycosyltransferase family 2 protein [Phocaeicola plebeius]